MVFKTPASILAAVIRDVHSYSIHITRAQRFERMLDMELSLNCNERREEGRFPCGRCTHTPRIAAATSQPTTGRNASWQQACAVDSGWQAKWRSPHPASALKGLAGIAEYLNVVVAARHRGLAAGPKPHTP